MDMVGHQAIGPHGDASLAAALSQEIAVERLIAVREKNLLPSVAALRDVMRRSRNDNAGETRHKVRIA